jgi:acyl carrier protein
MPPSEEAGLLEFVSQRLVKRQQPPVTSSTELFTEHLIDSMNVLDLIAYLERRLGRRLDDGEITMSRFRSVRAMAEAFFDHDS